MKVYVVSGSSNVGKTNTLHRLAILMSSLQGTYKRDTAISAIPPSRIPFHADRQYLFEELATGRKIGISTAGDDQKAIDGAFDFFAKNNCDVGFHVTPVYFWFTWAVNGSRSRNQVQLDTAKILEAVI